MSSTQNPIERLKQGSLPFVGRAAELRRIAEFCDRTTDAGELRAMLLAGETGIGKSRLLEQAASELAGQGGVAVHTKLYRDATTALLPNIATAMWTGEASRRLLRHEPGASISDVVEALRRLARLRPTALIIEDLHLLPAEAARDVAPLLDALADEALSIVCAARPAELALRGALERFIVDELELEGLSMDELALLWSSILGTSFDDEQSRAASSLLADATLGNPLAVRAALRASGTELARSGAADGASLLDAMRAGIEHTVGALAEGMLLGLDEAELDAAYRLSLLGEAFAPSAARALLHDADVMLGRLRDRGVIARGTVRTAPLPGRNARLHAGSDPAFAFTHSLPHRYLVERSSAPVDDVLRALVSADYIYSTVPFEYVRQHASEVTDSELAELVMRRTLDIASDMRLTPDWHTGLALLDTARALGEAIYRALPAERVVTLRARTLATQLELQSREDHDAAFSASVDELLAMTSSPTGDELLRLRLVALKWRAVVDVRDEDGQYELTWEQSREHLDSNPFIRCSHEHLDLTRWFLTVAVTRENDRLLREVAAHVGSVVADDSIELEDRRTFERALAPYYLTLFETEDELAQREATFTELVRAPATADIGRMLMMTFRHATGYADRTIALCRLDIRMHLDRGLDRNVFSCQLFELASLTLLGEPMEEILDRAAIVCDAHRPELRDEFRASVPWYLMPAFILRDDTAFVERLSERFPYPDYMFNDEMKMLVAMTQGRVDDELARSVAEPDDSAAARLHAAIASHVNDESVNDSLASILGRPIVSLRHLVTARWALGMAAMLEQRDAVDAKLRDELARAIVRALEWMATRRLPALMTPWIERFGEKIGTRRAAEWRARAAAIEREQRAALAAVSDDARLHVSLVGDVTMQRAGAERVKIRGGRIVTLLGLMVANEMVKEPLTPYEFRVLAAGGEIEQDPERSRKTMNMAVLRLREAIGYDAVLTDAETPRLNRDVVAVDSLDARESLSQARSALREGSLIRSHGPLIRALKITHGDVLFPGLFDDFFEALREDFESELRACVIDHASRLLREHDFVRAEEVLSIAYRAMPDDEEISELLERTLVELDRRTDARRIRLHSARIAEEREV